jgi:S1-C subfamily serine protease
MARSSVLKMIVGIAVLIPGFFLGIAYQSSAASTAAQQTTPAPTLPEALSVLDAEEIIVGQIYDQVSPSVVHITSRSQVVDFFRGVVPQEGTGSGFVYDTEGHIVTNNHVIEGAEEIEVVLADGTNLTADVVGADP